MHFPITHVLLLQNLHPKLQQIEPKQILNYEQGSRA